jgi:hypothetical protein
MPGRATAVLSQDVTPHHYMPTGVDGRRAAALDAIDGALAGVRCAAALLIRHASSRDRQIVLAILRLTGDAEAALGQLLPPQSTRPR